MAPEKVNVDNEERVWKTLYGKRLGGKEVAPKLKAGDRVRLNKRYRVFKKGYLPGWTEEVFVVAHVVRGVVPTYKIQEWDGTPLEGTFYVEDLQKVRVSNDDLFRVEKIANAKGIKSWCVGRVGHRSTTPGSRKALCSRRHEGVLRASDEYVEHDGVSRQPSQSFQEPITLPTPIQGTGMESGIDQHLASHTTTARTSNHQLVGRRSDLSIGMVAG